MKKQSADLALKSKWILSSIIAVSISWTATVHAQLRCEHLFRPPFESAVEVEIGAVPKVLDLFTTEDGTLRPIVGKAGVDAIPEQLLGQLRDFVGADRDPLEASWDLLSASEKSAVISLSAEVRKHNFSSSRVVPGLKYRDVIELEFKVPTQFLGRLFSPGRHLVASKDIFGSTKIEYMGPNRMTSNLGFELHVRTNDSAGANKMTSEAFQRAMVGQTQNVHAHIVAPYPEAIGWAARWPKLMSAIRRTLGAIGIRSPNLHPVQTYRVAEFVRRTNLYFDLKMVENGTKMTTIYNEDGGKNFFPSSTFEFLGFVRAMQGETSRQNGFSKAGTVGVRTKAHYDAEVWGIEVRYMSPRLESETTSRVLDFVQSKMTSGEFYLNEAQAESALSRLRSRGQLRIENAVRRLLYSNRLGGAKADASATSYRHAEEKGFIEDNDFVKMLYHDWSIDPMFVDRPARVAQIENAQDYCRKILFRGVDSAEVMRVFVKKSGIAYDMKNFFEANAREAGERNP